MGTITLVVSLLFSACLLVRDLKRRRSLSMAIWVPNLFFMMLASRPLSAWLGMNRSINIGELGNDAGGTPVDQVFYFGVIAASFLILWSRRFSFSKLVRRNSPLVLFYVFFAVSILWSGDPSGSLKRWVKDVGIVLAASVVLTEKEPLQAIGAIYFRCAAVMLPLSVVFIRWIPALGRAYGSDGQSMFTGVTTQKNTLGELALVSCLFLLWEYLEKRKREGRKPIWAQWDATVLAAVGIYILFISQSKTALMCLIVASALLMRPKWLASAGANTVVLAAALSVPVGLLLMQQFSAVIAPVVEAFGRDMTFTGRTDIWQHITLTTVNPLVGAGFYNFWGGPGGRAVSEAMDSGGFGIPNAHNGYVDMFLDGGVIGLLALANLLIRTGRRLGKTVWTSRYASLRFAFLIAMILYNNSETTYARQAASWFTMLLLTVEVAASKRNKAPLHSDLNREAVAA